MRKEGVCASYKCGHHKLMDYFPHKDVFTCNVKLKCEQCDSAFFFGSLEFSDIKCPHPNCPCTEVQLNVPVGTAIKALRDHSH